MSSVVNTLKQAHSCIIPSAMWQSCELIVSAPFLHNLFQCLKFILCIWPNRGFSLLGLTEVASSSLEVIRNRW